MYIDLELITEGMFFIMLADIGSGQSISPITEKGNER